MNLHEYQAKQLLVAYDLPLLKGVAVTSLDAFDAAVLPEANLYVVKAQIHAGGRGEGKMPDGKGGVRFAKTLEEARAHIEAMLGNLLVTKQTVKEGKQVNTIFIETGAAFDQQIYLSLLVDRQTGHVAFVSCAEGGTSIEDVAEASPEKICTLTIDPLMGILPHHVTQKRQALGLDKTFQKPLMALMTNLLKAFIANDMAMLEINPLVTTADNQFLLLDAKVSIDDNALYRHPAIAAMRDASEEDAMELEAIEHDLNYIRLDGNVGCMVNGAGLAMATMDTIQKLGGEPANFLDVGGGATKEKVTKAFQLIQSDSNVKGILVNIFGGIMRCDVIAEGIIAAVKESGLSIPLVVRLAGTNVEEGKKLLAESGLPLESADSLTDGAHRIIAAIRS